MVDFHSLRKEIDEQLDKCDLFFQEHKIFVHMYVYFIIWQKQLENKKYNFRIEPTEKGNIMIDIISSRKRLKAIEITKQKIKRHAKEYELFD